MLSFLLPMVVEEDKGERKEAKEEGVFLQFGDNLVVDDDSH